MVGDFVLLGEEAQAYKADRIETECPEHSAKELFIGPLRQASELFPEDAGVLCKVWLYPFCYEDEVEDVHDLLDEAGVLVDEELLADRHEGLFDVEQVAELAENIFSLELGALRKEQTQELVDDEIEVLLGEADVLDDGHHVLRVAFAELFDELLDNVVDLLENLVVVVLEQKLHPGQDALARARGLALRKHLLEQRDDLVEVDGLLSLDVVHDLQQ
jgi:hypothetical protein